MKKITLLILLCCLFTYAFSQKYLNYALGKPVETSLKSKNDSKITDGLAPTGQWRCNKIGDTQWVSIDLTANFKIYAAHIYFDAGNIMPLTEWVLQYYRNGEWLDIPGTIMKSNYNMMVEQVFMQPIETDKIRLLTVNKDAFGIDEIQLWGSKIPKIPYGIDKKQSDLFVADKHYICVNQVAYNVNAPKFFTVPTAKSNLPFQVINRRNGMICYKGKIKNNKGDFSNFKPKGDDEYFIRIEGDNLGIGESFPFEIGYRSIQKLSYPPAVNFMNDARSLVGSHPSAYGGTPWRDGTYYTYELPSMVLLYLSDKSYFNNMPVTLSWSADSIKVLSPNFKSTREYHDRDALTTVQAYYTILPKSTTDDAPDLIQDICFTAGWYLLDPMTHDPSGDPKGEKMHPQTIEQLAYFLFMYPVVQKYVNRKFYELILNFTLRWWKPIGLFEVLTEVGTGKGRECPGHSIMPNLMMYEVAKRECPELADRFMNAAINQTKWIINNVDWKDPIYTKGQRMNEHRLVTGLTYFYLNYFEKAPEGLKDKIEELGKHYVSLSNNMWDFRRFDMCENWTLPGFNECGNIAAFPACAFSVAMCVEDETLKKRLIQLGYSHFDNLYGRNPLNAHAANHPENGFYGVDRGYPYSYYNDVTARLENTRGSLSALPGSEMYPFNPNGKTRHPEGWTAYNASWNVGLAYLNFLEGGTLINVLSDPLY